MKAEIIILFERDYSVEEIWKLTNYSKPLIYYYHKKYKNGVAKIEELKKGKVITNG